MLLSPTSQQLKKVLKERWVYLLDVMEIAERLLERFAVIVGRDLKFSRFHLYQKCPFKTIYVLYNILKVSKTSKFQLQRRPTFTVIAPP